MPPSAARSDSDLPMRTLLCFVFLLGAAGGAAAQSTQYVTDSLRLESRTGPSTGHRIMLMLDSGTPLEVLEEADGWSRIILPSGEEAWMLSRYLMPDPPARVAVERATAKVSTLQSENARLAEELARWRAMSEEVTRSRDSLASSNEALTSELDELKRTSASAVQIRAENIELTERLADLRRDHTRAEQDYTVLRASRERDWFLAGGGVLLGGMLLGLIIPKIRWKRRRSWGEL